MSTLDGVPPDEPARDGTTDNSVRRLARVALSLLTEPGNRELGILVHQTGPCTALTRLLDGDGPDSLVGAVATRLAAERVRARPGRGAPTRPGRDFMLERAEAAVLRAERLGARIVTPDDDEWPVRIVDLVRISRPDAPPLDRDVYPPLCLWVRGDAHLRMAFERSVAVVGARAASSYGAHVAAELAYGLADRDWSVVSGGAFGIDAAAHRGALAAGGLTLAIMACGIDRPYPLAHASLFERIADEGMLISEWPPGAAPHRLRFLIRNRVIAAGTRGTILVEAAARSGARQTLRRARALGRAPMAVPGPVTSAMSVGCHLELRGFATRLVTTVDEVIEEVGHVGELAPVPRGESRPYDALDPAAVRLLDAVLPRRTRTAEEVAAAAGVSGREARRVLPLLVDAGFVVEHDCGYRLAARPRAGGAPGPASEHD